jgi:hypothetical protein
VSPPRQQQRGRRRGGCAGKSRHGFCGHRLRRQAAWWRCRPREDPRRRARPRRQSGPQAARAGGFQGGQAGRRPLHQALEVRRNRLFLRATLQLAGKRAVPGQLNAVVPDELLHLTDSLTGRRFLVDTGASFSIFPHLSSDPGSGPALRSPSGEAIPCWGEKKLAVEFSGRRFEWTFLLAKVNFAILGADFLKHFNLIVDLAANQIVDAVSLQRFYSRATCGDRHAVGEQGPFCCHRGDTAGLQRHLQRVPVSGECSRGSTAGQAQDGAPHTDRRAAGHGAVPPPGSGQAGGPQGQVFQAGEGWHHPAVLQQLVCTSPHGDEAGRDMAALRRLPPIEPHHYTGLLPSAQHPGSLLQAAWMQLGCPRKCFFNFRRNTEFFEKPTEFREIPRNSAAFLQ